MRKFLLISMACFAVACLMNSCFTYKEIGRVNMVSTRNVTPGSSKYKLLASYAGEDKDDMKKCAAKTLEEAINRTIRKYPGGEFMTNVKFYRVHIPFHPKQKYAVGGDIYGVAGEKGKVERSHRGFAVGDTVTWKRMFGYSQGVIKTLQDDEKCIIQKKSGRLVRKKYSKLSK